MATTNENLVDKINTYFDNSKYSDIYSNESKNSKSYYREEY